MATNKDICFDTKVEGFHFYDLDFCLTALDQGYINYCLPDCKNIIYHNSERKDLSIITTQTDWIHNETYYQKKWKHMIHF